MTSGVFIVNFEQVSHILLFPLLVSYISSTTFSLFSLFIHNIEQELSFGINENQKQL